jgi:integrase
MWSPAVRDFECRFPSFRFPNQSETAVHPHMLRHVDLCPLFILAQAAQPLPESHADISGHVHTWPVLRKFSPLSLPFFLIPGCVRKSAFALRWESITWFNGRHGTLLVTHGKTAAARRVLPMTPRVRNILEIRWEGVGKPADGWVWSASTRSGHLEGSSLKKQHGKALRLSGVRPFVLYSLRHTFLTRLGESGCDAWTLARIAGHSSIAMSTRYVHPSEDAVLNAMSRLGGHKSGTVTKTKNRRTTGSCS